MATYEGIIDIVNRKSEAGDTRISEAGDVRIAEQYYPESLTADDIVNVLWAAGGALSESVAVSDSVDCQVTFQGVIAESALTGDTIPVSWAAQCALSESGLLDDSILLSWVAECALSESGTVNDVILPQWIAGCILSESISADDSVLTAWVAECVLSEVGTSNYNVNCQVIFQGTIAESVLTSDSALTSWIAQCILAESSLASDIADELRGIISELIAVSDSVDGQVIFQGVLAESINVADATSILVTRIYAWLEIEGNETFAIGDILRIKDGNDDEWLEVSNIAYAPIYGVIRDKAGKYAANANPAWTKGAAVVNYRKSGDGGIYMTSSEINAPYMSVITHAGSPWNSITTHIREGNLNGYAGYTSDIYGWAAYINANNYIKIDPTNGIRMTGNITITGGDTTLDNIANGATYSRVLTTAISAGKIVLTSSGVSGSLPTSLSDAKCTNALADQTSANTAADTTLVNGLASTTIILAGKIGTGLVVANSIVVGSLSAINANLGTVTAGIAKSSDDKLTIDFNNKWLKVWDAQATPVLRVHLGYIA